MTALRVGVVGAGTIGHTHLNAYREAGAATVAVTDVDPAAAEAAAAEFGLTSYPDAATMFSEVDLDAVSICTPPVSHAEVAVQALRAGIPVLCEKPMALTVAECDAMITAAEQSGTLLTVGHCHRFQPQIETMKSLIETGRIGTVLTFRNRFSGPLDRVEARWFSRPDIAGGGVLMDTSVHSIDIFRYLVGEIDRVVAVTATTATDRGPALEVEDSAVLGVRSVGGVLGVIEASWRTVPGEALVSVSGTEGRLDLDYSTPTLSLVGPDRSVQKIDVPPGNRFALQARSFLDCIANGTQHRVTASDGARAITLLAQAYASAGPLVSTTEKGVVK